MQMVVNEGPAKLTKDSPSSDVTPQQGGEALATGSEEKRVSILTKLRAWRDLSRVLIG